MYGSTWFWYGQFWVILGGKQHFTGYKPHVVVNLVSEQISTLKNDSAIYCGGTVNADAQHLNSAN